MEENNKVNTQQNTQGGQSGQVTRSQQNFQHGSSFVVDGDTADIGIGAGGVVSLKGGLTQKEIDEQNKIEELKKRAVKLERKLTPKERELEKMHKEAIKPTSPVVKVQNAKHRALVSPEKRDINKQQEFSTQAKRSASTLQESIHNEQKNNSVVNTVVNSKKQEELVENLINPIEQKKDSKKKAEEKSKIDNSIEEDGKTKRTEFQTKEITHKRSNIASQVIKKDRNIKKIEEKRKENASQTKRRMVISPAGQISYIDSDINNTNSKITSVKNNEKAGGVIKGNNFEKSGNNVVNLKSENSQEIVENNNQEIVEIPWENKKVDLKSLTPEKRLDLQSTPSMASVNFNMDDDLNKEMVAWFDRYNELPVNIKLGLGSSEVRQKIKELANKLGLATPNNPRLTEGNLGEISRIIRDIYVNLIKEEEIKNRIKSVLKIQEQKIKNVLENIANIVALVKDIGNKKSEEYFEKLSLREALEKYPKIKDQEVTSGIIVDKKTGKYIKPTVQNWIDDYINQMGSGQHTNLERGKYLSDSINIKNLDEDDKKAVEKLIKSQDENSKLIIDREEKNILWNLHQDESQLGINSDKNKRVINKFKIENAQVVDHEQIPSSNIQEENISMSDRLNSGQTNDNINLAKQTISSVGNNPTNKVTKNLENDEESSIINGVKDEANFSDSKIKKDEELLDLSSEIPVN